MKKYEIWVCNQCSGSWDSLEKYVLKMKNGGFISCCPDSNPRPYLPSSRVKDLVKAAKRMNNYVKEYSGSEMSVQFELLSKNIETALKQFEEEK